MIPHIQDSIQGRKDWTTYEQLGFAVYCMLFHKNYSLNPVLSIQHWTEFAIQHRQIKFIFDSKGQPLAYVTWAFLGPDTEKRLLNDPEFRLHHSEWNEGDRIWILDFCCRKGFCLKTVEYLKILRPWGNGNVRWMSRRKRVVETYDRKI